MGVDDSHSTFSPSLRLDDQYGIFRQPCLDLNRQTFDMPALLKEMRVCPCCCLMILQVDRVCCSLVATGVLCVSCDLSLSKIEKPLFKVVPYDLTIIPNT